ncbi:HutD/Ves family protein [Plantibacter sp. CFBP 13570]|uniref:HutD/Ves family protein n=1 Tax=Plantibacter sp. CFBP 13570 TaxID=2775272 RepID=UPI001930B47C|nr:HutD family protein [Plantibacter sp. CFBP 13570]MBD8537326.1 HutD family protein [Plantibacter sp. CFBP 13570]
MSDSTEGPALVLLPAAGHRSYRWRNGLGTATEIAVEPVGLRTDGGSADGEGDAPAAPGWTLSIATVESDVTFSSFPGVDRQLMALSAGGLGLVIDGEPVELDRWQVAAFDGASAVSSRGVVGPTLDLNLMVSRDRFRGSLEVGVVDGSMLVITPPGATTFVVFLDGLLSAEGPGLSPGALQRHDALRLEAGTLSLTGDATIALAQVLPHL